MILLLSKYCCQCIRITTLSTHDYCKRHYIMIFRMLCLLILQLRPQPLFHSIYLPLIPLHNNTEIQSLSYEKLCICSGAQPKVIAPHPNIIGLRDLQSVTDMAVRLSSARKVIIVGNGGIALELVHSVRHHQFYIIFCVIFLHCLTSPYITLPYLTPCLIFIYF